MADFTAKTTALLASMDTYNATKLYRIAPTVRGLKYTTKDVTTTSGTITIDFKEAQMFFVAPVADITFTFINLPNADEYIISSIRITNGGAYTVTWPAASMFEGGTPPVLSASGEDLITVQYDPVSAKYWITNVKSNWQ